MKRSHSQTGPTLSEIPKMNPTDSNMFKSSLPGSYIMRVKNVYDISKPRDKQIEAIDEPEEEEIATINRLNKSNARMLLLELRDCNNSQIKAIETESIEKLNDVKPNFLINISGPVDIRCGNLMLEKRHVISIEPGSPVDEDDNHNERDEQIRIDNTRPQDERLVHVDTKPTTGHSSHQNLGSPSNRSGKQPCPIVKQDVQVIDVFDDADDIEWDDDDCIILD